MELKQRAKALVDEFSRIPGWEERYKLVIKKGKQLQEFPDSWQQEKFRIKGCQSQVWLVPRLTEGRITFDASSDAMIVKGIISLLLEVYDNASPKDILDFEPQYLSEIGITDHLSMNRTNGLASMMKQIKLYAVAYQSLVDRGILNADHS